MILIIKQISKTNIIKFLIFLLNQQLIQFYLIESIMDIDISILGKPHLVDNFHH